MLRLQLFGSGRLFYGDAEIKLASRMWTLPLLSYLVLHRGEPIPRWRLAFALWPDEIEETALLNLRRNLHRLINALPAATEGRPWIEVDATSIAWNQSADFEADVLEFERLRADPPTVEQAVSTYGGDLLCDVHFDWVAAERERLRKLYQADLVSLIVAKRSRRAFPAAAHYAQRLLDNDPWREDAVRHLMSVRYESGDGAGALAEFDRFSRELRAEMNVDPMPETVALREAIRHGAPIAGASRPPDAAGKESHGLPPFVGREKELERLRGQWQRAARGRCGVALVTGPGGIGKSRLVSELALIVEAEGGRVLAGTTSRPESDPYQSIAGALRGALPLVAAVGLAPPLLAALAELIPELRAHRNDVPRLARLNADDDRSRLLDALTRLLAALAKPRPVLVILEDLHRAGAATIDVLRMLVPQLSRSAILVVATYRPEDVDRSHPLRSLERSAHILAEGVPVGPLDRNDVSRLVEALTAESSVTTEFVTSLLRQSEGNPLFVIELLRDAQRSGLERLALPTSVKAMIVERVAALTPASRAVAEIAATAGEAFTVDLLRDIAALPESELLDGLDGLLDRRLVRESTDRARYEYLFAHHLIHAAIYENIPAADRARRHRRIARLLDVSSGAAGDERAREIALHYERGGDPANAASHYASAAKRAVRLNADVEARDLIAQSLALDSSNERQRFELLLLRSKINARLANLSVQNADQAELERSAALLDDDAICAALVQRASLMWRRNDGAGEADVIERLARHAVRASDYWRGAAAEVLSVRAYNAAEYSKSISSALEARTRFERAGDDSACARVAALAARAYSKIPGRSADADRLIGEALLAAERARDVQVRLDVLRHAESVVQEQQQYGRLVELSTSAIALCLEVGAPWAEGFHRTTLGIGLWAGGQLEEALKEFREALRLTESLGALGRLSFVLVNYAGALSDIGDYASAIECYRRSEDGSNEERNDARATSAAVNHADVAWQCGDIAALGASVDRAAGYVARLEESRDQADYFLAKSRLRRCERNFAESIRELERAEDLFARTERWSDVVLALDDLALTHLGRGKPADALLALTRGSEVLRARAPQAQYPIRRAWIEACVHRAAGNHDESRRALARAFDQYDEQRAGFADSGFRASFEAIPVHRAICAALNWDQWPDPASPCVVAFPGQLIALGSGLEKR